MHTLVCRHCGKEVPSNKRLKHLIQYYCGEKACQAARKQSFERHKYKTNTFFRSKKLQQYHDRMKKKADEGDLFFASRYQHSYRASHPLYVEDNREKQRQRNARKRDKISKEAKIVNPDTLIAKQIDNDMVYAMIEVDYKKIVNPDTFMTQLADMESITKVQTMFVRRL